MPKTDPIDASSILKDAWEAIDNRASQRDNDQTAERSMEAAVNAFNALYDTDLTETQGWMFMVFLKAARARQGDLNMDDYIDGAAYFALAGESALVEAASTAFDKVGYDFQKTQAEFLSTYDFIK